MLRLLLGDTIRCTVLSTIDPDTVGMSWCLVPQQQKHKPKTKQKTSAKVSSRKCPRKLLFLGQLRLLPARHHVLAKSLHLKGISCGRTVPAHKPYSSAFQSGARRGPTFLMAGYTRIAPRVKMRVKFVGIRPETRFVALGWAQQGKWNGLEVCGEGGGDILEQWSLRPGVSRYSRNIWLARLLPFRQCSGGALFPFSWFPYSLSLSLSLYSTLYLPYAALRM